MPKKLLIIGFLVTIILVTTGCGLFNQTADNATEQTQAALDATEEVADTATPTATESPTETVTPTITATLPPTETATPTKLPYTRASQMSAEMAGESIQVCGEVTGYEEIYCPGCVRGYYAYLTLDDNFYIISYDWAFSTNWIGSYIQVKDTVETMGSNPIFVFGGTEGWDETECELMPDGTLSCDGGSYFKFVPYCAN